MLPYTSNVKYHKIVIFDQAPLSRPLKLDNLSQAKRTWTLDPQLSKEPEFKKFRKVAISFFFEMNDLLKRLH